MSVVYYEGERIYFRPLEMEDEATLRRWINDPRVWMTLHHRQPMNAVREKEWIESLGKSQTDYAFGIMVRETEQFIGTCGLHRANLPNRAASYGLMIGDVESHGQGYGTEATKLAAKFAFEELNLNRVELHVFDFNPAAIRAYEKAGFTREGALRQAEYRNGAHHDVFVYSLLREEWERG